jgi:hypothetical protein
MAHHPLQPSSAGQRLSSHQSRHAVGGSLAVAHYTHGACWQQKTSTATLFFLFITTKTNVKGKNVQINCGVARARVCVRARACACVCVRSYVVCMRARGCVRIKMVCVCVLRSCLSSGVWRVSTKDCRCESAHRDARQKVYPLLSRAHENLAATTMRTKHGRTAHVCGVETADGWDVILTTAVHGLEYT